MRKKRKWEEYPPLQKDLDAGRRGTANRRGRRGNVGVSWMDIAEVLPFFFVAVYAAKVQRRIARGQFRKEVVTCKTR